MVLYCYTVIILTGALWGAVLWAIVQLSDTLPKPAALPEHFMLAAPEDNDIKIAPDFGGKHSGKDELEPSEDEIQQYFCHKRCHNLEHARQLGRKLGENILFFQPQTAPVPLSENETSLARMLYLFVTEDCVRRFVADPILLKLVLAQINDTISMRMPNFYSNLYQYRSYTVYKMCLKEEQRSTSAQKAAQIGRCWAQLAGHGDESLFAAVGQKLYLQMKYCCEQTLKEVSFVPVS